MYTFKENVNESEYNDFIKKYEFANFMQEISWTKVKDNFDSILCGVYKNEKLVAACSILIRKITRGFTMFYIPR